MNKEMKLTPELRFPDFKNEGEWNYDKIDNLFHLQDGYAFSSNAFTDSKLNTKQVIRITDINNQNKNGDKVFVLEETTKALGVEKYKVKKGDLLLSLTGAAGFNFFIWESDDAYINQRTMKLNPKKKENDSLKVILEPLVHSKINEIGTGQNNNLSKDALKEIEFPYPNPKEQQKIASCLSSLDEVISAHSQKLELLKDHKKGLMQNLFPQEGETVPKVRFPEFEGDGEWIETSLSEISPSIFDGTHQTPKYTDDGIPFFSVENIVSGTKNKFISREDYIEATKKNKPEEGDVLVTRIGSIGIPKVVDWDYEFSIYVTLAVIKKSDQFISQYLASYIQSSRFQKEILRRSLLKAAPQKINMNELRECEILLPPDEDKQEQQKIASCLSALDELITAQQEKIEQLQQHKKGLMQGLFPKIES